LSIVVKQKVFRDQNKLTKVDFRCAKSGQSSLIVTLYFLVSRLRQAEDIDFTF